MPPALTLRERQVLFSRLLARLILHAELLGYEVAINYATRSPEENERIGGHPDSLHLNKLAVDLDLFKDGHYLENTEDHRDLGEWWEQQHALCAWGGRFDESEPGAGDGRDGNHYSVMYRGMR